MNFRFRPTLVAACLIACQVVVTAQTVERSAAVAAGGHGAIGTSSLGWSLGQVASGSYVGGVDAVTAGVQQPEGVLLAINIRVLLDGPYREQVGLMHDSLRVMGLLPLQEPYSGMGYGFIVLTGGEQMDQANLLVDGPDAIVDWVFVELRDANQPTNVLSTRAALLQRDGDVVDTDGASPLKLPGIPGNYHVAVHHRNHLPVMTGSVVNLGDGFTILDLLDGSTATFGTEAQREAGGLRRLWAGDVNADGVVRYTGGANDRDLVLQAIGGTVPTASVNGYLPSDVNLDGKVRYTGADNDRDPILQTIGGTVPTAIRLEQLP